MTIRPSAPVIKSRDSVETDEFSELNVENVGLDSV